MEETTEELELEPLFDYSRVQPTNFVTIDDDCSDSERAFKLSPKRRKREDTVKCLTEEKACEVTKVIELDEKEEDWLLPPPLVSKTVQKLDQEDSTIKQLRLKKQELASFALSAGEVLRAVEESAKREPSSSVSESVYEAEPPPKVHDDRAKIVISIQDKDGLKQFRVYVDEKFDRFFKQYADKVKREIRSLVFCFDGDKISPTATPASLGMEDDDIIEVHVRSN